MAAKHRSSSTAFRSSAFKETTTAEQAFTQQPACEFTWEEEHPGQNAACLIKWLQKNSIVPTVDGGHTPRCQSFAGYADPRRMTYHGCGAEYETDLNKGTEITDENRHRLRLEVPRRPTDVLGQIILEAPELPELTAPIEPTLPQE